MQLTWKKTWSLLFFIVLLGAGLRFFDLGGNSFVADEFLDINSSYGYFKTGEWKAWDFNFDQPASMNQNDARDGRAFLYKWQVAQLFHFLPPTEATARSVSALWGVFTILLMFWAGWFYTKKKTIGLLSAFLFAVSVSALIFDRRLRMYAMFTPVYLAFATTLFAFFECKYQGKVQILQRAWERLGINLVYLVPVAALGGMSLYLHLLSANIVPVVAAYFFVLALLAWKRGEGLKNKYAVLFGIGAVATLLFLVLLPDVAKQFTKEITLFDNHYSYFGYILTDFAHPFFGAILGLFGAWFLAKKLDRPKASLWLLLSVVVPLVLSVWFWRRNAGPQYIFFAQSFLLILSSIGVFGILRIAKEKFPSIKKRAFFITLALAVLLLPQYGYFLQENNTYHETTSGENPNYRKIFAYFKKNKEAGEVLITRNFRNYYFAKSEVQVYDFGGELSKSKFSVAELQAIVSEHPKGWLIVSENDYDYISNEAEVYFKENFTRVSNSQVRGPIEIYRW